MSLMELRLARAARLVREAVDDERGAAVPQALLDGLDQVVPALSVLFTEIEPSSHRMISQSSAAGLPHDCGEFWRIYPQIEPLHYLCDCHPGSGGVIRLSDFTSDRVLLGTSLYQRCLAPNGERYVIAAPLPTMPGLVRGFFFFRGDRDFAEADRDLLTLLSPHLQAVYESHRRRRGIPRLTMRQWQVLRCLAQGQSTEEVAAAMCVSQSTVRKHLENIYERLGVTSRAGAIGRAMSDSPSGFDALIG